MPFEELRRLKTGGRGDCLYNALLVSLDHWTSDNDKNLLRSSGCSLDLSVHLDGQKHVASNVAGVRQFLAEQLEALKYVVVTQPFELYGPVIREDVSLNDETWSSLRNDHNETEFDVNGYGDNECIVPRAALDLLAEDVPELRAAMDRAHARVPMGCIVYPFAFFKLVCLPSKEGTPHPHTVTISGAVATFELVDMLISYTPREQNNETQLARYNALVADTRKNGGAINSWGTPFHISLMGTYFGSPGYIYDTSEKTIICQRKCHHALHL